MNEHIEKLFKRNNGILKAADLYSAGATRKEVSAMLNSGEVIRIKRGYISSRTWTSLMKPL